MSFIKFTEELKITLTKIRDNTTDPHVQYDAAYALYQIEQNQHRWQTTKDAPIEVGYSAAQQILDGMKAQTNGSDDGWTSASMKEGDKFGFNGVINTVGKAHEYENCVIHETKPHRTDGIEPLLPLGGLLPYPTGKVTGKQLIDMVLPVMRKVDQIIARLERDGGRG